MRWSDLGPGFIRRVLLTTAWLGGISFLCLAVYLDLHKAVSWTAGVALGIANLLFLNGLVKEMLRPTGGRPRVLLLYALLKFPAVYLIGAAALIRFDLHPLFVLGGFSLFLAVAFLKVLGRLLLGTSWMARKQKGPGGPLLRGRPGGRRP